MAKAKKKKPQRALTSWLSLNKALVNMSEKACQNLIKAEKAGGKRSSYLLRITSNLCLSKLRKRKVLQLGRTDDDSQGPEPEDMRAGLPGDRMLDVELKDRVRAAVDALPERQRMAILLNKFEGLDYQEVARHLDLSPAATKSLLHRARMALKDLLSDYLAQEGR